MLGKVAKREKMHKEVFDTILKDDELQCIRCEWIWTPRIEDPKCCPHCKSYEWKEEKVK